MRPAAMAVILRLPTRRLTRTCTAPR
jgi:hypothetical protein